MAAVCGGRRRGQTGHAGMRWDTAVVRALRRVVRLACRKRGGRLGCAGQLGQLGAGVDGGHQRPTGVDTGRDFRTPFLVAEHLRSGRPRPRHGAEDNAAAARRTADFAAPMPDTPSGGLGTAPSGMPEGGHFRCGRGAVAAGPGATDGARQLVGATGELYDSLPRSCATSLRFRLNGAPFTISSLRVKRKGRRLFLLMSRLLSSFPSSGNEGQRRRSGRPRRPEG
jgi:hypothetical protein